MEGGVEYHKLIFRVGKRLAFERSWPQGKDGFIFKTTSRTGTQKN
jgi:hypothetical protein